MIDSNEYTSNSMDFLMRIRQTEYDTSEISYFETQNFITPFVNLYFENHVLRHVLKNQWRSYKYNQEYIHYLLGGYSEEEFLMIAPKYALPFEAIDDDQLSRGASIILNILGETLTSGDLSSLLNVDPLNLEKTLNSYPLVIKSDEIEGWKGFPLPHHPRDEIPQISLSSVL
jgi:hypothetical protein